MDKKAKETPKVKSKKKITIKKDRFLISISNDITLTQRKIFNVLILVTKKQLYSKPDALRFQIELTELENFIDVSTNNRTFLYSELMNLIKKSIEFDCLDNDFADIKKIKLKGVSLIHTIEIDNGVLYYEFPQTILDMIKSPKIYGLLELTYLSSLNSKFSLALYEFLKDRKEFIPDISITECKKLLCGDDNLYSDFTNFKRRVLDVACGEITDKTDIECSYTLNKKRHSYQSITFKSKNKLQKIGDYDLSSDISTYILDKIQTIFFKNDKIIFDRFKDVEFKANENVLIVKTKMEYIKEYLKANNFDKKILRIILQSQDCKELFDKDFTDVIIK